MDSDLMDGLSQEQFERVRAAERRVTEAHEDLNEAHNALDAAMQNLADVQREVLGEMGMYA